MTEFWQSVTEPQATIIAAILTIIAAIVGVVLGAKLFGGKVKDLESAIDTTSELLNSHKDEVEKVLAGIQESLGRLAGSINEIGDRAASEDVGTQSAQEHISWERLRELWIDIRDEIERLAADLSIDGRTRAKYSRIDRRQYWKLISAMSDNGHLKGKDSEFEEANEIWQAFKSGRKAPDQDAINRMVSIRGKICGN